MGLTAVPPPRVNIKIKRVQTQSSQLRSKSLSSAILPMLCRELDGGALQSLGGKLTLWGFGVFAYHFLNLAYII